MLRNFFLKNGILPEVIKTFLSFWLLVSIWKKNRLLQADERNVDPFFDENYFRMQ